MQTSPLWISHRGLAQHHGENTLEAFTAAVKEGFTALETDLRVSADGHIVLAHDPGLERLFQLNASVSQRTRKELSRLKTKTGEKILFFDEFAAQFASCHWTLDIKPEDGFGTIKALARLIQDLPWLKEKLTQETRFLHWRGDQQKALRNLLPGTSFYAREKECYRAALAVLCKTPILGGIEAGKYYALTYRFRNLILFKPEIVRRYHERGAKVTAFLPETESEVKAALAAGMDEILTNHQILRS